jgi:alpha-D-ribose 1-methylphosphonate 5-triphosphate synthase subunit PhnH
MAIATAFADPVHESQAAFRAVMNALARPGTIQPVAGLAEAPKPLSPVAAAVALALADYETPVYLDATLAASAEIAAYLTFHTGARTTPEPSLAAFALFADPARLGSLEDFALGTDIYPDRSTTLILQVDALTTGERTSSPLPDGERATEAEPRVGEGTNSTPLTTLPLTRRLAGVDLSPSERGEGIAPSRSFVLKGPGIKGESRLSVSGLPTGIIAMLADNHALFPRGVDLVLAGPDGVAALPRTTRVREA